MLDASALALTASENVEEVVRTQLLPTIYYLHETGVSLALAEYLAYNAR
jgi:hypothetical protein